MTEEKGPLDRTLQRAAMLAGAAEVREALDKLAAIPLGRYSYVQVGPRSYKLIRREDFTHTNLTRTYRQAVYRVSKANYTFGRAGWLANDLNTKHQDSTYREDGIEWIR